MRRLHWFPLFGSLTLATCSTDVNLGELSMTEDESGSSATGEPPTTGGTGEPEAPEDAPVLEWSLSPIKQFEFTWTPVAAGHYELMESADVDAPYLQVGEDIAADATQLAVTVPLYARYNARYVLRACNGAACSESAPVAVTGSLAEAIGYVKAGNPDAGDNFGANLAISADGGTLAVSAPLEDSYAAGVDGDAIDDTFPDAGAVYVYTRVGEEWVQEAYIKASNTDAYDQFGFGLALSGDGGTLAVGAPYEASVASGIDGEQGNGAFKPGAVYVFTREGGAWAQQAYIKAQVPGPDDLFGYSVALSGDGDTLAVGAPNESSGAKGVGGEQNDDSSPQSGAAYVFTRAGEAWSQQAFIKAENALYYTLFGNDVALDDAGDTLAVGAPVEETGEIGSGAGYVFQRTGDVWAQEGFVKATIPDMTDFLGMHVALSGDGETLAVAAMEDGWQVVGEPDPLSRTGSVYVYRRDGGPWPLEARIKSSIPGNFDLFGSGVRLSGDGNLMAVGSRQEDSAALGVSGGQGDDFTANSGAAYVFTRTGAVWLQQAHVKAPNTESNDYFGRVALSADGRTLAVGADGEAGGSSGVGGDPADNSAPAAGAVYIY